jgi:predicted alpha/beta-fold hydrolase
VNARSFVVAGQHRYRPAWWLPGGHAQTLWVKFARKRVIPPLEREVWALPDGDNIELRTLRSAAGAPQLLLLHGLEGTVNSHYVGGMMSAAAALGWGATLLCFRGCSDEPNIARRFYHSGETTDVAHVYALLRKRTPESRWFAVGVSLGGNVLLKWLGEQGSSATIVAEALMEASTVFDFDETVTAPVHGFTDAHDYYSQSSSESFLSRIRVPTLLLSSRDDPFLGSAILGRVERLAAKNPALVTEFVSAGGHVGFVEGALPWKARYYGEERAMGFLRSVDAARRELP